MNWFEFEGEMVVIWLGARGLLIFIQIHCKKGMGFMKI